MFEKSDADQIKFVRDEEVIFLYGFWIAKIKNQLNSKNQCYLNWLFHQRYQRTNYMKIVHTLSHICLNHGNAAEFSRYLYIYILSTHFYQGLKIYMPDRLHFLIKSALAPVY